MAHSRWRPRRQQPCGKHCAGRPATTEAYITRPATRLFSLLVICTEICINVTLVIQDTQANARRQLPITWATPGQSNAVAWCFQALALPLDKYINTNTCCTVFMSNGILLNEQLPKCDFIYFFYQTNRLHSNNGQPVKNQEESSIQEVSGGLAWTQRTQSP